MFINLLKNTLEAKKENRQLVVTIKLKEYKENKEEGKVSNPKEFF